MDQREGAAEEFRDHFEWAVGHGVSVEVPESQGPVTRLCTTWIPRQEVRRVITREERKDLPPGEPAFTTDMETLGALPDGDAAREKLGSMVEAYGSWIEAQALIPLDSKKRDETRVQLLKRARHARDRIQEGIDLLAHDPEVLDAFRLMNRAMALAALQRSPDRYKDGKRPTWRSFQLAFVLLNLAGVADENHRDREEVELIFFPTGGGKTEAYLGVIAFTLLLRRLRGRARPDGGLGVAVLLRYTLRLLTLDQLGRAATLVCALEILRREQARHDGAAGGSMPQAPSDPWRLGEVRFSVGLWVGRSATANTIEQVKKLVIDYKNSASKSASSPFPLTNCPWCGRRLGRDSLVLAPNRTSPEEVIVS
ncbi:hypothetical protein WME91_27295 [Sorangium sp. So ce269]